MEHLPPAALPGYQQTRGTIQVSQQQWVLRLDCSLPVLLLAHNTSVSLTLRSQLDMLAGESDVNPYLQQEVMSASPVRLRWMLIKRSEELCDMISHLWAADQVVQGNQWLLRIREILGELLEGVKDRTNPLSAPISDFYVFLLKLTSEVEQNRDVGRLQVLKQLLAIESETWKMVADQMTEESSAALELGISAPVKTRPIGALTSLQAAFSAGAVASMLPVSTATLYDGGAFSLEV